MTPTVAKEVWAKLGNFSIIWVKVKPMLSRTSMLAYITALMTAALGILTTEKRFLIKLKQRVPAP